MDTQNTFEGSLFHTEHSDALALFDDARSSFHANEAAADNNDVLAVGGVKHLIGVFGVTKHEDVQGIAAGHRESTSTVTANVNMENSIRGNLSARKLRSEKKYSGVIIRTSQLFNVMVTYNPPVANKAISKSIT